MCILILILMPQKVAIVLEELGLKYDTKYLEFGNEEQGVKGPEHLKHNPNGRKLFLTTLMFHSISNPMSGIPTIIDHDNNDFTIWESNSIIKYLLAKYDTGHKLSFPADTNESFLVDQWMTFQVSGQVGEIKNPRALHDL